MATPLNRVVIRIVSGYIALLLAVAVIPGLWNPSIDNIVRPDQEANATEPAVFDHYFIDDVSLQLVTETAMRVNLHADQIVHRDRTLYGQIVLESFDEIYIDQLELNANMLDMAPDDQDNGIDILASAITNTLSEEFYPADDSLTETLTRVVVEKFSATFTYPRSTQLWIQSGEARLYGGLAVFEGGVSIANSRGTHFTAGTVVWDKHAGGFLMPFGCHNDSGDSTEPVFISLGTDGNLMVMDYLPASNWENVDIIDQISRRYATRLTGSMAMFFLTAGSQ